MISENDYSGRARIYDREFAVRDDFGLLRRVLAGPPGLVIDAPSGAGRLLDLHAKHRHPVILVDLEPAMVARCRQGIAARNLWPRVTAVHGDIRTWVPSQPADRTIIARGGLQVLPSPQAAAEAVLRSAANMAHQGILYIDIAVPWALSPATFHDLPVFMRFADGSELRGHTLIDLGDGTAVRRSHSSVLTADRVIADFRYEHTGRPRDDCGDFTARTSWVRIDPDQLRQSLASHGLAIMATLGDYAGKPYTASSSRFICVAVRRE